MIELTKSQMPAKKFQGRLAASAEMTPLQAKLEAQALMSRGLSPQFWRALDLLSTGGVLSLAQLALSERVLRKYAALHLLDRLPYLSNDLNQALREYGISDNGNVTFLYTLGPVGIEIAKQRHGQPPPTGYLGYTLQRTLHDVVLNEIVLRLARYAESLDWSVNWLTHYEATLVKDGGAILEPDALLVLRKESQEKHILFEYHNEDKQTRAHEKVRKYEIAFTTGLWQSQWETATFPIILAVFKNQIVGEGYKNAIKEREQVHCHYYGKTLAGVMDGNLGEWKNVATDRREQIIEEG